MVNILGSSSFKICWSCFTHYNSNVSSLVLPFVGKGSNEHLPAAWLKMDIKIRYHIVNIKYFSPPHCNIKYFSPKVLKQSLPAPQDNLDFKNVPDQE